MSKGLHFSDYYFFFWKFWHSLTKNNFFLKAKGIRINEPEFLYKAWIFFNPWKLHNRIIRKISEILFQNRNSILPQIPVCSKTSDSWCQQSHIKIKWFCRNREKLNFPCSYWRYLHYSWSFSKKLEKNNKCWNDNRKYLSIIWHRSIFMSKEFIVNPLPALETRHQTFILSPDEEHFLVIIIRRETENKKFGAGFLIII